VMRAQSVDEVLLPRCPGPPNLSVYSSDNNILI